mmetsp:Transcript_102117/g.274173  ORF Transcript_102117/g.274173 Transcript_102117/m.274173 type:complete len:818 (-) Transcript_102117:78-2531(-)
MVSLSPSTTSKGHRGPAKQLHTFAKLGRGSSPKASDVHLMEPLVWRSIAQSPVQVCNAAVPTHWHVAPSTGAQRSHSLPRRPISEATRSRKETRGATPSSSAAAPPPPKPLLGEGAEKARSCDCSAGAAQAAAAAAAVAAAAASALKVDEARDRKVREKEEENNRRQDLMASEATGLSVATLERIRVLNESGFLKSKIRVSEVSDALLNLSTDQEIGEVLDGVLDSGRRADPNIFIVEAANAFLSSVSASRDFAAEDREVAEEEQQKMEQDALKKYDRKASFNPKFKPVDPLMRKIEEVPALVKETVINARYNYVDVCWKAATAADLPLPRTLMEGETPSAVEEWLHLPHIIVCGMANAGKSALINHSCMRKQIARSSSIPGRTISMDFYCINRRFVLVDLPGYPDWGETNKGMSPFRVTNQWNEFWEDAVLTYFNLAKQGKYDLRLMLQLQNLKRPVATIDKRWIKFAEELGIPQLLVCTKTDAVKSTGGRSDDVTERQKRLRRIKENTGYKGPHMFYSVKAGEAFAKRARRVLHKWIRRVVIDCADIDEAADLMSSIWADFEEQVGQGMYEFKYGATSRGGINKKFEAKPEEPTWWFYQSPSKEPMAVRPQSSWWSLPDDRPPQDFIQHGEAFAVCQEKKKANVLWMKLADGRGWVFDKTPKGNFLCFRAQVVPPLLRGRRGRKDTPRASVLGPVEGKWLIELAPEWHPQNFPQVWGPWQRREAAAKQAKLDEAMAEQEMEQEREREKERTPFPGEEDETQAFLDEQELELEGADEDEDVEDDDAELDYYAGQEGDEVDDVGARTDQERGAAKRR